ncbi:solute carrier family 7 member 13 [Fukomys damarensis]|uniref:solute carrier family 7 member 13 n=1 Tax=Fukomys damarensis TaxID=885580 RepID=UPI00053F89B5|nr:solute carrier family 7 member 13 [Fukomys damarensis]
MQVSRTIGYFHGNIFLFSAIIGGGIFISPKGVLKYSALNIPVSLSIWVTCAILNMINALCVAELGTTFPRSAAPYFFMKRSLGSYTAFLNLWVELFGLFIGLAAQSLLVASYLIQPLYALCPPPELPKKCLALAILRSLGLLNIQGLKTVTWFQTLSTLVKVAILCFISITGIVLLVIGKKENVSRFENALDAELPGASQIVEAILQGFYAYGGSTLLVNMAVIGKKENVSRFENALDAELPGASQVAEAILQGYYSYMGSTLLIEMAGEVKNPGQTIPRTVLSALSIVTVIYLLTNVSFLTVLTPKEIISSDSVAVTWMDRVFPSMKWVIALGISASMTDSTSCGILTGSRLIYAASQEKQLPMIYSMLNKHLSPAVALIQLIIMSSIAVISSNLINLLKYLGIASWALSVINKIALLKMRYQEPDLQRPYKVDSSVTWLVFTLNNDRLLLRKLLVIYNYYLIFYYLMIMKHAFLVESSILNAVHLEDSLEAQISRLSGPEFQPSKD